MGIEHEHFSIRNSVINDNRELMPLAICSLQFAHIHFFRCQSNACHKSNCSLVSTVGTHTRAGCTINLIKCEKLKIFQFCFIVTSNSHWMFPGSNRDKDENLRALARIVCTWMDRARTSMIARMHTVRLPHFIFYYQRVDVWFILYEFWSNESHIVPLYPMPRQPTAKCNAKIYEQRYGMEQLNIYL